jgi:hypothetical protein
MKISEQLKHTIMLTAAVFALCIGVSATDTSIFANGIGNDPDYSTAKSMAVDDATGKLSCSGDIQNVGTNSANCSNIGTSKNPMFFCSVSVKATCHTADDPKEDDPN